MPNYLALVDQDTVAVAWLKAIKALSDNSNRAFNLIYSINKPSTLTKLDEKIIRKFDLFAKDHSLHPSNTVANTIFPLDTFLSNRSDGFYEYYLDNILPKVRKQWGTYFERMIRRKNDDGTFMVGKDGAILNPLDSLLKKVKNRLKGSGTTTHYEMALDDALLDLATFDPHHDGNYQVGGPCLSHLSFKVDNSGVLRLTALYRSHWYVARALGNLIGLARLQAFVAMETGATVGPLTIVASEAVLDVTGKNRTAAQTRQMFAECAALI